ncbi:MAG: ribosome silencing factor [Rubrivivax sp.]|nr:ribosome silencing factor [Rubrivivax sp.]
MDIRKLQRAIVDGLEDVKAQHITVFNTEHLSSMFERVIIASGTSNRQTKALAASVRDAVKSRGFPVLSTEGEDNGEWIIVDCGAAVAHIMQPAIREYYHLEEIWGGKSVRMKVGAVNTKLVKASEPGPARKTAAAGKPAFKQPAAKAPAAKKAAAGKMAGKRAGNAADKTAAKSSGKPPVKSPTRKAADKSAAYQRVGARRPTGKTMSTQTVARKTPARKTPRSA